MAIRATFVFLLIAIPILGQVIPSACAQDKTSNAMDMSKQEELLKSSNLVTVEQVDAMGDKIHALLQEGNCAEALKLLPPYAVKANTLANLIRSGIQPFYDASYDDRKGFNVTSELVSHERLANGFIYKRNRAWVSEADCLAKKGDLKAAAIRYSHALHYIAVDETVTWEKAREGLWKIVGAN